MSDVASPAMNFSGLVLVPKKNAGSGRNNGDTGNVDCEALSPTDLPSSPGDGNAQLRLLRLEQRAQ